MKTAYHINNEDYYTIPDSMSSQEIANLKQLCRKNTFQCPFCKAFFDAPSGPERYPYFRHRNSESCEEAEEFEKRSLTFSRQIERENTRHPIVVSILKDELKLLDKIYDDLKVLEGRFDPIFKKYIPDLVVYLNKTAYTIQVITQINELTDEGLAKQLIKRKHYYEEHGYIPLWFVERGQAATEVTGQEIVLWQSEQALLQQSMEDLKWSNFIQSFTTSELLTKVLHLNKPLESLKVQSIYYLSAKDNAKFDLFRTIMEKNTFPNRALIVGTPYELTIQEIFKVKNNTFLLEDTNIDEAARLLFKSQYDQEYAAYIQEQTRIENSKKAAVLQTKSNSKLTFTSESLIIEPYEFEVEINTEMIQSEKATAIEEYKLYLRNFTIESERTIIPAAHLSLFNLLNDKYKLTTINFPGICKTKIYGYQNIPLPVSMWQLWVIDKILTTYQNQPLTVNSLANSFGYQFNIHRVNLGPVREVLNTYLLSLEQVGILGHKRSEWYKDPHPVNVKGLPLINSLKENSYIAFYFSNYYYAEDPFGKIAKESVLNFKHSIKK